MAPNRISKEEIISQKIKSTIYRLPTEQADNICTQVIYSTNILRKAKPPVPNITRQERLALQELKKDILVLSTGKGK